MITERSALDLSNSQPAAQSHVFLSYTRLEARRTGESAPSKPPDVTVRVAERDGLTIVSESAADGRTIYHGIGTLSDGTPLKCTPNTTNTVRQALAERRFGVRFATVDDDTPIPTVMITGSTDAIKAYIFDEFANGNLLCEISGRPEPGG